MKPEKAVKTQQENERKSLSRLNEINPKTALVQVMNVSEKVLKLIRTKFGKILTGALASYPLTATKDNFNIL